MAEGNASGEARGWGVTWAATWQLKGGSRRPGRCGDATEQQHGRTRQAASPTRRVPPSHGPFLRPELVRLPTIMMVPLWCSLALMIMACRGPGEA